MPDNYYKLADRAIELLNKRAKKRIEDANNKAATTGVDAMSELRVTRQLYSDTAR